MSASGSGTKPAVTSSGSPDNQYTGHQDQGFGCVTYSQYGEDLIILNVFSLLGIEKPSYIDVGAHHPEHVSNTALLYKRGSRGINIEPNPNLIDAFRQLRPEDRTLNVGIATQEGTLEFLMVDDFSGRNTFDRDTADRFIQSSPGFTIQQKRQVPVRTLDSVVVEYLGGVYPDLLSIDAEGLDYEILEDAHFSPQRPMVICAEVVSGASDDESARITALLQSRGYEPYVRTVCNVIFVHRSLKPKIGV